MESKSWCFPGQLLLLMLAGWINRHQQAVIAYQREETKVLREMLGRKRLRFTDGQRRRLALKAKALSHRTLKELGPLVTPDTLCRWFRKYAGAKYDRSGKRRPGRPPKPQYIRDLMVRLAKEITSWGYTKLRDVIFTLGHEIGRTTVRRILAEYGIEPAPERRKYMPWATFLKAHWGAVAAMDFFKVEVMTLTGAVRNSVLVSLDPGRPGAVRKSSGPGDPGVLGVVSESPGLVLGSAPFDADSLRDVWGAEIAELYAGEAESLQAAAEGADPDLQAISESAALERFFDRHFVAVAMAGRVPVAVDARDGEILPGDRLVPGSVPGFAGKGDDDGIVIGTALERFSGGGRGRCWPWCFLPHTERVPWRLSAPTTRWTQTPE